MPLYPADMSLKPFPGNHSQESNLFIPDHSVPKKERKETEGGSRVQSFRA